jgi:hypothetical protein
MSFSGVNDPGETLKYVVKIWLFSEKCEIIIIRFSNSFFVEQLMDVVIRGKFQVRPNANRLGLVV